MCDKCEELFEKLREHASEASDEALAEAVKYASGQVNFYARMMRILMAEQSARQ